MEDDDYFVRNEALSLFSMGRRKDKRAVEPLIKLLKDKSLRQEAVHALGYLNDSRAVEPLTSILLKDKNWMAREGAAWALKEIKDNRAVGALILALQDNIGKVRSMSAWALQEIADSKALLPLKKAF
ncbi:MAG: HEAT repeat domain-containing protein, partial [Deltaproteobacteria bacterium]|nr:HEAT repeat domain-containing protein [Deltaproteobacteria bacterium]